MVLMGYTVASIGVGGSGPDIRKMGVAKEAFVCDGRLERRNAFNAQYRMYKSR